MAKFNNMSIKEWAVCDRPSYKMKERGTESMTNAELISILIGNGTRKENAVTIARKVLTQYGNSLNEFGKATIEELKEMEGIGDFTACRLMAAIEIGKRRQLESARQRQDISSPTAVYNLMHPQMMDLEHEEAHVLLLNQNYKLIKQVRLSQGGITETSVDIRVIMKNAILNNATVLVLCHNHPSGRTQPSRDDDNLTKKAADACKAVNIRFVDHIIFAGDNYYSYQENGKL
jgi:DNA repair protein RadC